MITSTIPPRGTRPRSAAAPRSPNAAPHDQTALVDAHVDASVRLAMTRDVIVARARALPVEDHASIVCALARAVGLHVLCLFEEASVRDDVRAVIETDDALAAMSSDDVTDDDIHAACIRISDGADLSEERGAASFQAALVAISTAKERRRTPQG